MEPEAHCPTCGTSLAAGAPAGLCPQCLLGLALGGDEEATEGATASGLPETIAHYSVLERIGRGGMGEVWLAHDTRLDRRVALKFLPAHLQYDVSMRRRFLAEARAAAALDHPYICHIHEVGHAEDLDYIAMEFVEGRTLADRLAEGPIAKDEALRLALEIAEALEAAHERSIVHRDLKPSNVMVTRQGHVKIMDFGLAKRLDAIEAHGSTVSLDEPGRIVGTVAYMAPEQLRAQPVSTAADLFAFGIVLYEMLTGRHPFLRDSMLETGQAILEERPAPPPGPAALQALILRLLAQRADARGSVHAARRTLAELVAGGPDVQGAAPRRWSRRVAAVAIPLAIFGSVLAFEHVVNRRPGAPVAPVDDRREVYVSLAFDRWGTVGEDRVLLEASRKLRTHIEQLFTGLPATEALVRPEFFDGATMGEWSFDRSPGAVVAALDELDVPVDLVLRNRLEQPEPGALVLLSSLQRLQGGRLVSTGRFVRAEGREADVTYVTLRVAFGLWLELQRGGVGVFEAADGEEIRRRVLRGLQEVLVGSGDGQAALQDAVRQALTADALVDDDVALLLDARMERLDAERLAERIAARRRANLTKLRLGE